MILLHNTHAYPGCRASLPDGAAPGVGSVIVGFSDGTEVPGEVHEAGPEGLTLTIAAHRTARGTAIPRRRWRLTADAQGWRVAARLC